LNAILRRPGEILDLLKECRRLGSELFLDGGATIDTAIDEPHAQPREGRPSGGRPIVARTVIQPDGDVVCFATDRYCLDADLRAAHSHNVATWYRRAESTLSQAVALMRSLSRTLGAVISLIAGGLGIRRLVSGVLERR